MLLSAPAKGDVFDADHLTCRDLACAYVYQGEGVTHPQLVVQIWRSGVPQFATTKYSFVYDFPPSEAPSISFYVNSHLAHRTGPAPVLMSENDALGLVEDGFLLAQGIELALAGPATYDLNFWPNRNLRGRGR